MYKRYIGESKLSQLHFQSIAYTEKYTFIVV